MLYKQFKFSGSGNCHMLPKGFECDNPIKVVTDKYTVNVSVENNRTFGLNNQSEELEKLPKKWSGEIELSHIDIKGCVDVSLSKDIKFSPVLFVSTSGFSSVRFNNPNVFQTLALSSSGMSKIYGNGSSANFISASSRCISTISGFKTYHSMVSSSILSNLNIKYNE